MANLTKNYFEKKSGAIARALSLFSALSQHYASPLAPFIKIHSFGTVPKRMAVCVCMFYNLKSDFGEPPF